MSNFEQVIQQIEARCPDDKEVVIALATIALPGAAAEKPYPSARMVCAYYKDGVFYVSTDARKNKSLQIAQNNQVSVCTMEGLAFHGTAENLGWVQDEPNAAIRAKFKQIFPWFAEEGGEEDPNSIVMKITLSDGTVLDGPHAYHIDFVQKTAQPVSLINAS